MLKPVKKLILRFAARKAAETVRDYLERNIHESSVLFLKATDGVVTCAPASSYVEAWNGSGPRNVLLFVHGTFSSVDGSFGGLLGTSEGADFLSRALDHYDAVIGYDHKTLSRSVRENAEQLREVLETLPAGDVTFDAIAYSRGGLVLRYLTEVILPREPRRGFGCAALFSWVAPTAGPNWPILTCGRTCSISTQISSPAPHG